MAINARSGSGRDGELCVLPSKVMKEEGATVGRTKKGMGMGMEWTCDLGDDSWRVWYDGV